MPTVPTIFHVAPLVEVLGSVAYGDLGPDAFLAAIYAGLDRSAIPHTVRSADRPRLDAAWAHPRGLVTWEGPIPGAVGHYVVPNPYSTRLAGAYDPVALAVGSGLTTAAVGQITTIACEVDEAEDGGRLQMAAQAAIYDAIEAETGLRFAAAVLSGDVRASVQEHLGPYDVLAAGKSLHVYLSCVACPPTQDNLRLRQEAADALVALTGADAACRDLARKMRFGGVIAREQTGAVRARVRVQTLLRAEPVAYGLQDIRDRLVACCARRGIDVAARIAALQLVARARALARSWERTATGGTAGTEEATDAAATLREAALRIRKAGRVLDAQRRIIEAVGGPRGQVTVVTATGAPREITIVAAGQWDPTTTILTHNSGESGTAEQLWATHLRGRRVPDVHCVGHADAHASAFLTRRKGGVFAVHCPVCGVLESAPLPVVDYRKTQAATSVDVAVADDGRAAALKKEREDDRAAGVFSPEFEFREVHSEALVAHPLVVDAVARDAHDHRLRALVADLTSDDSDGVSSGLSGSLSVDHSPDENPSDEVVGEAIAGVGGTGWLACQRGPVATKAREGGYSEWRIACKNAECPVCGPWLALARRSSARVVLRRLGLSGWSAAEPSAPLTPSAIRLAQSWAKAAPAARAWVRARQPDGTTRDLIVWATPGDAPRGVLGRGLVSRLPEAWAEEAVPGAPLGRGVRVLTGTAWLVGRVNGLLNAVLASKRKGDGLKVRVTGAHPAELRDAMERAVGSVATTSVSDSRYKLHQFRESRSDLSAEAMDAHLEAQTIWRGGRRERARRLAEYVIGPDGWVELAIESA